MRLEKDGTRTVLAGHYDGKRFGGPNDVVVRSDGAIYFTDTFGAFRLRDKDPRKELDFQGVYMGKNGEVTLVSKDIPNVNGLAFSPDEKYLYVNGSRDNYVNRYDVLPDGRLVNGKLLIDLSKDTERGVTDGMRVDTKGNLYETGPGGVWIISPESTSVQSGRRSRQRMWVLATPTRSHCILRRARASEHARDLTEASALGMSFASYRSFFNERNRAGATVVEA